MNRINSLTFTTSTSAPFGKGSLYFVAHTRLCLDAEVLQNDQLTSGSIPTVEEDDLEEGLKLEMRATRELSTRLG